MLAVAYSGAHEALRLVQVLLREVGGGWVEGGSAGLHCPLGLPLDNHALASNGCHCHAATLRAQVCSQC